MSLDELDIEGEDFETLTGLPPYPQPIVSMPSFQEDWPKISAAMHGYATRRYLEALGKFINSSTARREFILIFDLFQQRECLEFRYEILSKTYQEYIRLGLHADATLARHNMIWHCRVMEYNREDIEALKEGYGKFLQAISERKWGLGRVVRDM